MKSWFGLKTTVKLAATSALNSNEVQEALANEANGRPMKAVQVMLDEAILDRTTAAMDETLPDSETKFYLGGAAALAAFKEELAHLTRPRP